jgi:gamma-glutamyltranspeptidase/glutathione hydrolase
MARVLHTVSGQGGIVTAPHLAAQAGLDVLKDGGSAAQATMPWLPRWPSSIRMTGIGGDGFWLIREADGRVHSVHGVGGAAQAATLDLYSGHAAVPWRGPLAANTVAGTLSAWDAVLATEPSSCRSRCWRRPSPMPKPAWR